MCGIIYYENTGSESVSKAIKKRYFKQKHRGSRGFGFVAFDVKTGDIKKISRQADEKDILKDLDECKGNAILFHHRFPTSTPNYAEASHPILVSNDRLEYDYYVVHNGVLWNERTLKTEHEKLGYVYTTEMTKETVFRTRGKVYTEIDSVKFNDSESLAIELAEFIEGHKKTCDARGTMAFIVLQKKKKSNKITRMYWGRNTGNPLLIDEGHGQFSLRSENGGKSVDDNTLNVRYFSTNSIGSSRVEFKANSALGFDTDREDNYNRRPNIGRVTPPATNLLEAGKGAPFNQKLNDEAIAKAIESAHESIKPTWRKDEKKTSESNVLQLPVKLEIKHVKDEVQEEEEEDGIVSPFIDDIQGPYFLNDYMAHANSYINSTKDLLEGPDRMTLDEIYNWIEYDLELLTRVEFNARTYKRTDELYQVIEMIAELEDRQDEIMTMVDADLAESIEEVQGKMFETDTEEEKTKEF